MQFYKANINGLKYKWKDNNNYSNNNNSSNNSSNSSSNSSNSSRNSSNSNKNNKSFERRIIIGVFCVLLIIMAMCLVMVLSGYTKEAKTNPGINQNMDDSEFSLSITNSNKFSSEDSGSTKTNLNDASLDINDETFPSQSSTSKIADNKTKIISSDVFSGTEQSGIYSPINIEPIKTNEVISATTKYFNDQIPALVQSLKLGGLYYCEKLLDQNTGTVAYIVAKNDNYAQNLNGYFYYLFDKNGYSSVVSPFVLNISLLFDEENRKTVVDEKTFSETKHLMALKNSLKAVLGVNYSEDVFNLIISEYRRTFDDRINGKLLQNPIYKLQLPKLEVIFHNSFITYIEFFILN